MDLFKSYSFYLKLFLNALFSKYFVFNKFKWPNIPAQVGYKILKFDLYDLEYLFQTWYFGWNILV